MNKRFIPLAILPLFLALVVACSSGGNSAPPSCAHPVLGGSTVDCTLSYNEGYRVVQSFTGSGVGGASKAPIGDIKNNCIAAYSGWSTQMSIPDNDAWVDGCMDAEQGRPSTPRDN